jgi:hypothetical protein
VDRKPLLRREEAAQDEGIRCIQAWRHHHPGLVAPGLYLAGRQPSDHARHIEECLPGCRGKHFQAQDLSGLQGAGRDLLESPSHADHQVLGDSVFLGAPWVHHLQPTHPPRDRIQAGQGRPTSGQVLQGTGFPVQEDLRRRRKGEAESAQEQFPVAGIEELAPYQTCPEPKFPLLPVQDPVPRSDQCPGHGVLASRVHQENGADPGPGDLLSGLQVEPIRKDFFDQESARALSASSAQTGQEHEKQERCQTPPGVHPPEVATAAATKSRKSGWARHGRERYSGWN